MEDLPDDGLMNILIFLDIKKELTAIMRTCKKLQTVACKEDSWKVWCKNSLSLTDKTAPVTPGSTDKAVYNTWRECAQRWSPIVTQINPYGTDEVDGPVYLRVLDSWRVIENFYTANLPAVRASLNPCARYDDFTGVFVKRVNDSQEDQGGGEEVDTLDMHALRPLWYVYSIHNGQQLHYDEAVAEQKGNSVLRQHISDIFLGLFGGYMAYDHVVNVRLWSLREVTNLKLNFVPSTFGPVAGSFNLAKMFGFRKGRFVCRCVNEDVDVSPVPAVMDTSTEKKEKEACRGGSEFLSWFEEFSRRLGNSSYKVGNFVDNHYGVVQFPAIPGEMGCTRAVTRGVEVVASSIIMYEHPQSGWTYSVRVRLLNAGEEGYMTPQERGFDTCQLQSRHWAIEDGETNSVDHVRGRGVIGKFPLLKQGGYRDDSQNRRGVVEAGEHCEGAFVYQSCSGRLGAWDTSGACIRGWFGGELIFVPGNLDNPTGQPFDVRVERFPLARPAYLF